MKQIINWHMYYITNDATYKSLHFDLSMILSKYQEMLYNDYVKLAKSFGICHMNQETFDSKYISNTKSRVSHSTR